MEHLQASLWILLLCDFHLCRLCCRCSCAAVCLNSCSLYTILLLCDFHPPLSSLLSLRQPALILCIVHNGVLSFGNKARQDGQMSSLAPLELFIIHLSQFNSMNIFFRMICLLAFSRLDTVGRGDSVYCIQSNLIRCQVPPTCGIPHVVPNRVSKFGYLPLPTPPPQIIVSR